MKAKLKKPLIIGGIVLDVGLISFLFIVSIIMLCTMPKDTRDFDKAVEWNGPFIGTLQKTAHEGNPLFIFTILLPLVLLLITNIVILVIYVKKTGQKKDLAVDDLNDKQREALKAQLLKDLSEGSEEK